MGIVMSSEEQTTQLMTFLNTIHISISCFIVSIPNNKSTRVFANNPHSLVIPLYLFNTIPCRKLTQEMGVGKPTNVRLLN